MSAPLPTVLLLHNRYRGRGGEERALLEQANLLRARGHRVELLERSSEELVGASGRARAARALLAGGEPGQEVAAAVRDTGAAVVHAHNLHPLLGARALEQARGAGARTVLQLHNFRLWCAIGVAYREGAVCHRCRGRDTLPGLRLRCRGGLREAAVYAAGLARQQPRLLAGADRLIALSEASRAAMGELGLPLERTDVIANPLPSGAFASASAADRGSYALCVGRLVPEKGFDLAIAAARVAGIPLRIAGRGPEEGRLRELAAGVSDVELLGQLDRDALDRVRAGACVVLAPSRWEEHCPYAVLEAMAAGVPVLASAIGGLPELAGQGASLPVGDAAAWARALAGLWGDPDERRSRGEGAIARAREVAGDEVVYRALMGVYARAGVAGAGVGG